MNLRDYLSNSVVVNKNIMDSDRANSTEIKVLGIHWNAIEDTITLQCSKKQVNKISKRTVLSQINGYCYDPLGLLSPLMIPAKIFLQGLHKQKYACRGEVAEKERNDKAHTVDICGQLQASIRLLHLSDLGKASRRRNSSLRNQKAR
ncbi:hypothetical protein OSTOST_01128 [Ostertagia ostertagi]